MIEDEKGRPLIRARRPQFTISAWFLIVLTWTLGFFVSENRQYLNRTLCNLIYHILISIFGDPTK